MELEVIDINGQNTGRKHNLADNIFDIEPNTHAIYLDVKRYLANQRTGTHKAKGRSDIAGSTRKLKKQKGTGTARIGSKKSPVLVGGGRAFGPIPRSYNQKINKSVKRLARRSALSLKVKEKALIILEDFNIPSPKTKDFFNILKAIGVERKKTLFLIDNSDNNVYLASRNLQKTLVLNPLLLSTYNIVNAENVVVSENVLPKLIEVLEK